ncbi:hypothetical protein SRHO_G00280670 [Serrasalmus rhombeus]
MGGQTSSPSPSALESLLYSLYTYDCLVTFNSTTIVKIAYNIGVVGLIEKAYLKEIQHLDNWCKENHLVLKVSKKQQRSQHTVRSFYTCNIKSILMRSITASFGNSTKQYRQALKRVEQSAAHIIRMKFPDLQSIYSKQCCTKARKRVKNLSHPNNGLFSLS